MKGVKFFVLLINGLFFYSCEIADEYSDVEKIDNKLVYQSAFVQDTIFEKLVIKKPKDWEKVYDKEEEIYAFKSLADTNDFRTNFSLQKFEMEENFLLESVVEENIEIIQNSYKKAQIHKLNDVEISSFDAAVVMNFSFEYDHNKMGTVVMFYQKGKTLFVFTGTGLNNYEGQIFEYMKVYDEVIWEIKHL